MKDFSAWSGEEMAVFVGAAFHYQSSETGDGQVSAPGLDSFVSWTIDGSIENEGWNLFASITGSNTEGAGATPDLSLVGFVIQSGYMVVPDTFEPFVRWEWIDPDVSHQVNLVSVGANYYLNRHNAKITADVVWAQNSLDVIGGSSGLGLLTDVAGETDQVAIRAQFQLLF